MPKVLTRLKISEVSAVDRAAGENCKILLRKRDQDAIAKATEALKESVDSIVACDDDDETKRGALAETFAQFQMHLDREITGKSLGKGVLEREQRRVREGFEKICAAKADDEGGDDVARASRDHRAGHHGLAAAVVEHALDRLTHLRPRYGFEKAHTKEPKMIDRQELPSILKQDGEAGLAVVCKRIIADGSNGISEND